MVWSYLLNTFMGFIMLITMLFCIGDLSTAIDVAEPFVSVFSNCGPSAATALSIILFILLVSSNNTALATESRQMWAFARDYGMPGSKWLMKIDQKWNVPLNCIIISMLINAALCLINLGSNYGFNVIIGLSSAGLLATYLTAIGTLIGARLRGVQLPPARWSLGKLGLPINIVAFVWCAFVFIFCFFPVSLPVTAESMNWVVVVFAAVVLIAGGFFAVHGKTHYLGPVAYTEGVREEEDVLQSCEGDVKLR